MEKKEPDTKRIASASVYSCWKQLLRYV